jgi:hypothetical protein
LSDFSCRVHQVQLRYSRLEESDGSDVTSFHHLLISRNKRIAMSSVSDNKVKMQSAQEKKSISRVNLTTSKAIFWYP